MFAVDVQDVEKFLFAAVKIASFANACLSIIALELYAFAELCRYLLKKWHQDAQKEKTA